MASDRQIFSLSGPTHLTFVDWKNPNHRRSVAASLVQGVYILERDRQQKRQGHHALAPPWWDFFHFQVIRILIDEADGSIFGTVYELKTYPSSYGNYPPRYVIAFRGTIIKPDTRLRDLKLGIQFIKNRLRQSPRFWVAMQAVQSMVSISAAGNIWLAGHSLGSAIALLAGKEMVKIGCFLETFLFDPPFPPPSIERIKNHRLKHRICCARSVTRDPIYPAETHLFNPQMDDSFPVLSEWLPYLFVNPSDPISSRYIGYFERREKMVKIGHGAIARFAKQNSQQRRLLSGGVERDPEASHLLPSAYLTVNLSSARGLMKAHGIHQWWKENMNCQFQLHQFRMLFSMNLRQKLLLDLLYDERIMKQASIHT